MISAEGVKNFLVDNYVLYYAVSSKVLRAALTGGAGVQIAAVGGTAFIGHAATSLYLRRSGSSNTTIYRILK